ncbi:Hypothetical_protein [Hexamita inflata]|uniref:Hypothetical_protein n=1 Tax=Hexamita inflata TaxID=28002 RepID=A0AA86U065_9EUKA|nr:Hypothetical protein HINF_LOCUS21182 [Hexamita inflata]
MMYGAVSNIQKPNTNPMKQNTSADRIDERRTIQESSGNAFGMCGITNAFSTVTTIPEHRNTKLFQINALGLLAGETDSEIIVNASGCKTAKNPYNARIKYSQCNAKLPIRDILDNNISPLDNMYMKMDNQQIIRLPKRSDTACKMGEPKSYPSEKYVQNNVESKEDPPSSFKIQSQIFNTIKDKPQEAKNNEVYKIQSVLVILLLLEVFMSDMTRD